MKRAAAEKIRTLRVWQQYRCKHERYHQSSSARQPGRFRKAWRAAGCGHARCWLCHADKLAGLPPMQERRASVVLREGLTELPASILVGRYESFRRSR
jgi:hypothetical protein